jgi:hypothetical protein
VPAQLAGLPPFVSCLFREIDEKNVDLAKNRGFIVERVLENGDDKSVEWCVKTFGRETIADAIEESTFVSPQTANLWALVLDLREERIRCLSDRSIRKSKNS